MIGIAPLLCWLIAPAPPQGTPCAHCPANLTCDCDLVYGAGTVLSPSQKLDLYRPNPAPPGLMPLVIFIHGGGFYSGSKNDLNPTNPTVQAVLARGWAAASIDYRLVPVPSCPVLPFDPTKYWPYPAHDVSLAIQYLRTIA